MINGIQESIIDIFIVCDQILPIVNKVKVLENDEIALIRYSKKVVKSDPKVLELGLEIKIHIENKHENRVDIFIVKNKKCKGIFKEFTSKKGMFTNAFFIK